MRLLDSFVKEWCIIYNYIEDKMQFNNVINELHFTQRITLIVYKIDIKVWRICNVYQLR